MIDEDNDASPLQSVPDRIADDGTNQGISLQQARDAIKDADEKHRAQFEGDPVYWDDKLQYRQ